MASAIHMKSSRMRLKFATKAARGLISIKEKKSFRETARPSGGRERRLGRGLSLTSRVGFQQQGEMAGRQRIPPLDYSSYL